MPLASVQVMRELRPSLPPKSVAQLDDNLLWIVKADENKMVVGSQARILYADAEGRVKIALAINKAISDGRVKGEAHAYSRQEA
jgi:urocanate hydratase